MSVGVLGPINALLADFGPVPVPVEHARRTVQQLSVSCLPSGGHNATPVPRNPPKRHMPTLGGTSPMGSPATSAWGTWDKAPTRVKIRVLRKNDLSRVFFKDRPKIADLKRSRVPLNGYRRNPGEINYTSRNLFSRKNEKQKIRFLFFRFSKNIFETKTVLKKSFINYNRFLGNRKNQKT